MKSSEMSHFKKQQKLLEKYFSQIKNNNQIVLSYQEFLNEVSKNPRLHLRNIFQFFADMVNTYVPEGVDEYPESEESVGFLQYDMRKLLEEDVDEPFFADRLLANRFMKLIDGLQTGGYRNQIYLIEGPAGSGKSTFLNNLLKKLELYTRSEQGKLFATQWKIPLSTLVSTDAEKTRGADLIFSCPHNDHPILFIPRHMRMDFLKELITDKEFFSHIEEDSAYKWLRQAESCPICKSIFDHLLPLVSNPLDVFNFIQAKPRFFDRSMGHGIVVWNPGDKSIDRFFHNARIEEALNELFKSDVVSYKYSDYAFSNNGVYVLMDIKENNINRFLNLHGIISDGIHKVENLEEHILSLFVGIINPEDKKHFENIQSFQDRIVTLNISYVLDFKTEVKIYENKFGEHIKSLFLPRVLDNFARVIISTRMDTEMSVMRNWLTSVDYYTKFIDKNLLLLRMELYRGNIPSWIRREDEQRFTRKIRLNLLEQAEKEGKKGISGRLSLVLFSDFLQQFADEPFITMTMLRQFFAAQPEKIASTIPPGFIDDLTKIYEINILQEVREAMYEPNEQKIKNEIADYLFSLTLDEGEEFTSPYTGDQLKASEDWWKTIEVYLYGENAQYSSIRKDIRSEFVAKTVAQEIKLQNKPLEETELFQKLYASYVQNLQKNSLEPFVKNENYKRALQDFDKPEFSSYDEKIQKSITNLIRKLTRYYRSYYKERYNVQDLSDVEIERRALFIARYVIEKDLQVKYKNILS